MAQGLANGFSVVDTHFSRGVGAKNICIVWLETNDFAVSGATVAAVYSNFTQYVAQRHQVGWTVIAITMISRQGNNPVGGELLDTDMTNWNNTLIANAAGVDAIVDLRGSAAGCVGCWSNGAIYQADGVHLLQSAVNSIEIAPITTAINLF